MTIALEDVQPLLVKLKAMLHEEHHTSTRYDKEAMQHLYNIEHYKSSKVDYDAVHELQMLKGLVDKCSQEVAEHLRKFLNNQ